MRKRLLSLLLAACLLVGGLPMAANASDVVTGTCGSSLTWSLDVGTRVFTITGTGEIPDYSMSKAEPWRDYENCISSIVIGEGITRIGDYAFALHEYVNSVSLPNSLLHIGKQSFYGCVRLPSISFPDSLQSIGSRAFDYNPELQGIFIPKGVSKIEKCAFGGLNKIDAFTVDEENSNFCSEDGVLLSKDKTVLVRYPCEKADTSYTIPNTITNVLQEAFDSAINLDTLTLPNSMTEIGNQAFLSCPATTIILPNTITHIGDEAFESCTNLKNINIPEGVTTIGDYVFNQTQNLGDVTFPASAITIGEHPFYNCQYSGPTSINVNENNPNYSSLDGVFFNKDQTLLLRYAIGKVDTSYTVPSSVTEIEEYAFFGSNRLKNITIPEGVTTIGSNAFDWCKKVEWVELPESLTHLYANTFGYSYSNPMYATNLSDIYYGGSRSEWMQLGEGVNSDGKLAYFPDVTIHFAKADVTYDAGGGTGTMDADIITKGEDITLPACSFTAPEGKFFKTWSINGTEYAAGDTYTVADDVTVTAVWGDYYTATFIADGNEVASVYFRPGNATLEETEPAVPAKTHYDGAWESYDLASAIDDITIHAVYTLNNDHQYTDQVTDPTCTEGGYTTHTCSVCGDSYTDSETAALGHNLGDWEETKAPTCTEKGSEKRTCSRCDYSETREIALANHTYTDTVTAPTCTEQGYTTHTCSVCGDKVIDTATPALGHDYQKNAAKSVAAERGKDGYDYFECSHDPAHFYTVPVFAPIVTHTATFVVGEEVIGKVTFEEGSTSLKEPNLPERKNYVGQWESYDLANAKTDITVHGQYTPVDPDKVSDVESGAETEYANGVATITLTAAAASKTIKVVSETTAPVDVVLVLDQSGSMAENLSRYDRQSKRDALVGCAKEFVQSLYENAKKTGADHRVAVTGFAYSAYNRGKYENTGLLATPSGNAIKYDNIKDSDYQNALLLINNSGEINQNVLSGIDSIVADGATAADLGLRMASNIFAENPTQGKRQRIVIFITDGTPTSWGEDASLIKPTAADAISIANNIKNGQDGKIYCVGVHANADSAAAFTSDKDGVKTDWRGNFISYDFNRFLHAVSSNYPDSKSMDSLGDGDKNGGYYMAVNDTDNLGNIFTNILYSTVYELKTFDKAAFHYTLPAEFTLTIEQEMALREKLKKTHGITDEDIVIERKADGTTELQFSNIPTKEAYDETGVLVYQATVTFKVTANQKASGSTGAGTGNIQYGDSALTEFTTPTVEVPADRHLLVFKIGNQVYQITEAELGDSITVPDSRLASWQVAPGTVVDGDYTVFEATTISDTKYNLTWSMNGTEVSQQYQFGEAITPPDPNTYAPEGQEFSRWSRSIPATMPAYDLECTAIYSPAHVHEFVKAYQTGDCDTGITIISRCACGEEKSEQAAPEQHNYTAVFSDNGYSGNTMEKLVCTKCGHSEEKNITFKVAYSESRRTTVLDLSLYENQVSVSEPDKEIELRFYIGGEDGKRYTITRIDPDGKRTKYQGVSENGYLVFKADHFSIYVIGELDEAGQETEQIDYEQAAEILDSKVDATEPEKPTPPTPSTPSGGGSSEPDESDIPDETWENPYTDISSAKWYFQSVQYVTENGLMTGFGGGKFGPGEELTRAQLAQVLYNREGKPAVTAENAFTDAAGGAWYSDAVTWAAGNDIVSGYGNNKFGPDDPITREQLATILWRYAGKPETTGSLDSFTDSGKASDWAVSALQWAVEQKIISGKGNGILDPKGRATRAEVAAVLMRYCELGK